MLVVVTVAEVMIVFSMTLAVMLLMLVVVSVGAVRVEVVVTVRVVVLSAFWGDLKPLPGTRTRPWHSFRGRPQHTGSDTSPGR